MNLNTKNGTLGIALGVYSKAKKGDKEKFFKLLDGAGFVGNFLQTWESYIAKSKKKK